MSCLKSSSNDMLCELCNQKAAITCPRCRVAHYCCVEHRKSDSKLHRKKCVGFSTTAQETQFTDTSYRHHVYQSMNLYPTAKYVVETLNRQGYCYLDGFHGEDIALKILGEVKELQRKEKFTDGQLVSSNGNGSVSNKKIRDDKITWVDGKEENCGTISHHMARVNALIRECNELIEDHEIEHRTKAMVACYPGQGTGYKKHVDNPNQDGRCITTLYYLNPGWTEEKGGLLKLFPKAKEGEEVKILPKLDRLLLFWSDHRNPHKVEPSHDIRYAITLWYFDKNERAVFRKKQEEEQRRSRVNSNQQVGSNQEEKESDSDN